MPTEITSNFKTLADIRGRKETLLKGIREDNEKMFRWIPLRMENLS